MSLYKYPVYFTQTILTFSSSCLGNLSIHVFVFFLLNCLCLNNSLRFKIKQLYDFGDCILFYYIFFMQRIISL